MLSLAKKVGGRICVDASSTKAQPVRVGPYRLCFELAAGGMASVYLAYQDAPRSGSRFAAVKVIHPHLANDPNFAEMFVDEAEIASRIRHPNVCAVYGYEVSEGASYLAMEYLVGESMSAVWRKLARARQGDRARNARLICKALADACEGLHAAHELTDLEGESLEIVHRDVSPANIVLTYDGVAKVLDFGVAAAARKRHRTETGMLKGKLAYIAPECLRGQRADRRTDVWAIGVVAWELATGQRLFRRKTDVETLRAVMEAPIRPPSEVRPELPKELDDVLMLALDRDPANRYETTRDLGRDLARLASGDEVVTSSDLSEWLERIFPGGRGRREQLLELAAQIASEEPAPRVETTPTTHVPAPPAAEHDTTRVYAPEPSVATSAAPAPEPRREKPAWALALGLGAIVGVASGTAATYALDRADLRSVADARAVVEPLHAAAPPRPDREARPELRLGAGSGLARGPYVLELVESDADELLLRIRLDRAHPESEGAAPGEAPPAEPLATTPEGG